MRAGSFVGMAVLACYATLPLGAASDLDEFKVKREENFEFAEKPSVARSGDRVSVAFATQAFCDATVVVEDERGRIVRHLASGVLGPNAPEPFQKNSLKQTVVWDGKDDRGKYIDHADRCSVRVSLGLTPRYERTLFWSPHKRISNIAPLLNAQPEGVYVFEGQGVDFLKLFDHDGNYLRTVYPFPANKLDQVAGLQKKAFPQGMELPFKPGFHQSTLLTSGSSGGESDSEGHYGGYAASAMAVHQGRIALAYEYLNRLGTDGSSGGLPLKGPKVSFTVKVKDNNRTIGPTSIAFSPDGKWLYLTGYVWKTGFWVYEGNCYHAVLRMAYAGDKEPEVFLGALKSDDGYGNGKEQFCAPMSVACDAKGRVYVADFGNDRVQVFSAEGTYLKSIPAIKPAKISIDPNSGEIAVFSWCAIGPSNKIQKERNIDMRKLRPTLAKVGTFDHPKAGKPVEMPFGLGDASGGWSETGGQTYQVAVDYWAKTKDETIWAVGRKPTVGVAEGNWSGRGNSSLYSEWEQRGVRILKRQGDKWNVAKDFAQAAKEAVTWVSPPDFGRQRLFFNSADEKLYVAHDRGFDKSFEQLLVIDPETGAISIRELPMNTEDVCFDYEGNVYLRTDVHVTRWDTRQDPWREVPFDYGEELKVGAKAHSAVRMANVVSALHLPGGRPVWWHMGGFAVNPKGNLAISGYIRREKEETTPKDRGRETVYTTKKYQPKLYPGRAGRYVVHIVDRRGKMIHEDAIPGLPNIDGVGIGQDDSLYVLAAAPRVLDGTPYFDSFSETLLKFRPGEGRLLSSKGAPIDLGDAKPERHPDIVHSGGGSIWAEGALWKYGGVGYGGPKGSSCACWHARFELDLLGRSFVPETRLFRIAVLDANGNLIVRVGQYGNVDSQGAQSAVPLGGDEVGLIHAPYVGVHTDRRLWIADAGNGRIVGVKLDYRLSERLAIPAEGGVAKGE